MSYSLLRFAWPRMHTWQLKHLSLLPVDVQSRVTWVWICFEVSLGLELYVGLLPSLIYDPKLVMSGLWISKGVSLGVCLWVTIRILVCLF